MRSPLLFAPASFMCTAFYKQAAIASICLAVVFSSGCTSLSPVVVDPAGSRIQSQIRVGDRLRVSMLDGSTHDLQVTAIAASSLTGTAANTWKAAPDAAGSRLDLSYADMRQVEVRRFSGGKTTGMAVGIMAGVIAVAVAVATGGGQHSPGFNR